MTAGCKLDRIDRRILAELQSDARLTNQALSERVALSPSACLARVRRLEQAGVIQGYHARLDPFALNVGLVLYAEIALNDHRAEHLAKFEELLCKLPQVVEASHITGDYDYLLKIVVADLAEWTRITEGLTGGDSGVERITTHIIMNKPKFFTGYPVQD